MSSIEVLYTLDDTTAANYTYDTDKIEFVATGARLKNLHPDGTCAANYAANVNLWWGDGVLTGNAVGGAAVAGGKLDLKGGAVKYVDYAALANADSQQVGAVRLKLIPNYNGSPVASYAIVNISKAAGDNKNMIYFYHSILGQIYLSIFDSTGTPIINSANLGAWSPTLGVKYEFELNWDITTGATRLLIEGTQHGATQTATGTRDANIGLLRIGSNLNATVATDYEVDDLIVFNDVQHTANYTAGYEVNKYDIANPTIEVKSGIPADGVNSWAETTVTKPGGSVLKYVLPCCCPFWWDGGSWSTSDETYAESNTQAEIAANLGTLDISGGNTIKFLAFLNSDGIVTPLINELTLDYDYYATVGLPSTCVVYGNSIDLGGVVLQNSTITIKTYNPFKHGNNMVIINTSDTSNANGFFDLNVVETASVGEVVYIEIAHTVGAVTTTVRYDRITIPNQANIAIGDLLGATLPNDVKYYKEGTEAVADEDPLYIRGTFRAI